MAQGHEHRREEQEEGLRGRDNWMLRGEGEREGERREGERRSEKPPPPPPPPPPPLPLPTSSELIAVSVCFLFSFPLFCVAAALCLKKKEAFVSGVAEFSFRRTRSLGGCGGRPAPPKEEFFSFLHFFRLVSDDEAIGSRGAPNCVRCGCTEQKQNHGLRSRWRTSKPSK